mmetsp:Transcript_38697/g.90507  ORF Transcript_38697/g.90507 Transcript_38697/m.90507 type:complete len:278 (+) Transcript_38697:2017-2850(+)
MPLPAARSLQRRPRRPGARASRTGGPACSGLRRRFRDRKGGEVEAGDETRIEDQAHSGDAAEVPRCGRWPICIGVDQHAQIAQRPHRECGLQAATFQFGERHEDAGRYRASGRDVRVAVQRGHDGAQRVAHGGAQPHRGLQRDRGDRGCFACGRDRCRGVRLRRHARRSVRLCDIEQRQLAPRQWRRWWPCRGGHRSRGLEIRRQCAGERVRAALRAGPEDCRRGQLNGVQRALGAGRLDQPRVVRTVAGLRHSRSEQQIEHGVDGLRYAGQLIRLE